MSEQIERAARVLWGATCPDGLRAAMRPDTMAMAQAPAAAGLLTPAGAAWHTDPPPGWSTFGAHAFMDEVPALEFWGEEYGGDGLPIWERPVQAPDADVATPECRDCGRTDGGCDRIVDAAPPDAATGESVRRFEFDEAEGIAFWVDNSDEEAAIKARFPDLFVERADAESVPATGEGDGR